MKYEIDENDLDEFIEALDSLEKLLDERIVDLHEIKGMMQARHAYILYRNTLLTSKYKFLKTLKHKEK